MAKTDLERLDALIADQEKSVREAFLVFIETVGSEGGAYDAILERLEARDPEGALKIVNSYIATFGNVLPTIAHTVGAATATELAGIVPDMAIAISFDPSHPRAAEIIRNNRLRFVRDFTDQQRESTLQALARAYNEGLGTAETARAFRGSIGLTPEQEAWVESYRQKLIKRSRSALQAQLRDRRSDSVVQRAIDRDVPLTEKQIDLYTERYRKRALMMRSETIARTEGVRATSEAREESLDQMLEQTGLSAEQVERIWNPTQDGRTRDWHASMKGQKRGKTEAFTDGLGNRLMYPGDPKAPAETTINCRCGLTFSIRPAA